MRRETTRLLLPLFVLAAVFAAGCGDEDDPVAPLPGSPGDVVFPPDSGAGLNERACTLQYVDATPSDGAGADPLFGQQWHLRNTGQAGGTAGEDLRVSQAWQDNRGRGVRIAVVDDAIEVVHQDLLANVVAGASYNYRPERRGSAFPLPCTRTDDHGTAVAGIIAARGDNGLGVSGVAPLASLVGYNALATGASSDVADALNRDLAGTGIFHNSWGAPDDGALHPAEASFTAAIDAGVRQGRAGRGAIYVFASGNGGCYATDRSGTCFNENSNYDGYVNKLGIISTCAIDGAGVQPFYGETGANFLVCGPSSNRTTGITTTTIRNDYRDDFTGTSASTPMVSGVVALMLAANPALTWRDVQQVLARSARRNAPSDPGWSTNFGLSFNAKFGFGAVDAQQAVALARSWTSIGGSDSLQRCGPFRVSPQLAIPDLDGAPTPVESTIDVSGCAIEKIEFVEVRMSATHGYAGDLAVRLVSPAGLVSELAGTRLCAGSSSPDPCGPYDDWPFGSVRHLDEATNGRWRLQVTDGQADDTGTLDTWAITFFGR